MEIIDFLIKEKWLKTERIIEAFLKIERKDFLTKETKGFAQINEPMPIGFGQTISQPLTVAFMIELLEPREGDNILDIGSGSGWTTALLANIVGKKGKVIGIEIIPKLKEFGEKNVSKYSFIKKGIVEFVCADGSKGYKKQAPFDRILVSASAQNIPKQWKDQLKVGGRIVACVKESIIVIEKKSNKDFEQKEHKGFIFVPLISK